MRRFFIIMFILPFPLLLLGAQIMKPNNNIEAQEGSRQEAERLWEQAIAAKGGRARLRGVRNLVVTKRATYWLNMFQRAQLHEEEFYVFPNKTWAWDDQRPSVFGLYVSMANLERNLFYSVSSDNPETPRRSERNSENSEGLSIIQAQLLYLMETEWVRPVLTGATRGRIGRQPVDIVHTLVNNRRVDFALHPTSHLPVNVSIYFTQAERQAASRSTGLPAVDVPLNSVALSDYTEVNGIQMPRTVNFDRTLDVQTSYLFNVAYDESIFERPPSIAAGPEAWRVARR